MTLLRIETARLCLRPLVADDLDDLHRLFTLPDVRRYLWDDVVIERARTREVLEASLESFAKRGFGQCALLPREEPTLVGFCGLRPFGEASEIEVLYALHPDRWGRGLATEAAAAMLRWAFEEHGLPRVFGGVDPPNVASLRVLEKLGMRFDRRMQLGDPPVEALYHCVSREEFRALPWHYRVHRVQER